MYSVGPGENSPKIIINFEELLFEISGISMLDDPDAFYEPMMAYVRDHFYQVSQSVYDRGAPSLTIHFYLSQTGDSDLHVLQKLDGFMHEISEFRTFIYWYYNPAKPKASETALKVQQTFKNPVRLIENSVHV